MNSGSKPMYTHYTSIITTQESIVYMYVLAKHMYRQHFSVLAK